MIDSAWELGAAIIAAGIVAALADYLGWWQ